MLKNKFPSISVIVLNYNGKEHLKDCLKSLNETKYPREKLEVIFADNNSTDGSVEYIKRNFPWVKILELDKNYGFAEGNNRGAGIAKGKYLVFLNNDTKVDEKWLIELVNVIRSYEKIGACTPKILYFDKPEIINCVGGFMSILGLTGSFGEGEKEDMYKSTFPTFFPSGCCFIIQSKLFRRLNGFDPDYFIYSDDTDFGWKLWNMGYKVLVVPTSKIYHKVSAVMKKSPMYYFLNTKNRLVTITRNASTESLIPILGFSLIFHSLQFFIFLFGGKVKKALATLKGMVWFFVNLNEVIKKRMNWKYRNKISRRMMLGFEKSFKIFLKKFSKHFI